MRYLIQKHCPCCGEEYNVFNYHLKTRTLPCRNRADYKCLHCLKCRNQISKKITIAQSHIRAIIILMGAWLFAELIRSIFNIWKYGDRLIVNIPFMVIFLILIYILNMYFTKLKCYSQNNNLSYKDEINNEIDVTNIHGIFSKKEKNVIQGAYKISSLFIVFFTLIIMSFILYGLFNLRWE